jgi:hypothetical protein
VAAVAVAGLAVTVAWLGTVLALATAEGVIQVPDGLGQTYDNEFIEFGLYVATAVVSVGLVGLAAWWSWPPAAVGWVGTVGALWWGGSETVRRYDEGGWSDGLEVLVYIVPVTAGMAGPIVIVLVLLARRTRSGGLGQVPDTGARGAASSPAS